MIDRIVIKILFFLSLLFTVSCGKHDLSYKSRKNNIKNYPRNDYLLKKDGYPNINDVPDLALIKEPLPRSEPKSRYGNPTRYSVFNKTYKVLNTSKGYKEYGYASWYGTKFHGFRTSSGEIYDMYAMTAAHKTLPLPTYAKITNLQNNRSVIVKINDRGPFHSDRIIDLSYAAASKIGIIGNGIGKVKVVAINNFEDFNSNTNRNDFIIKLNEVQTERSVQIAAFTEINHAQRLVSKLRKIIKMRSDLPVRNYDVVIVKSYLQNDCKKNTLYKVLVKSKDRNIDLNKIKLFLSKGSNT